jgi:hypothetical protein
MYFPLAPGKQMQTRRRISVLSALLFLMLIVVVVLWARRPRHSEMLIVFSPAGHLQGMATDRVGLLFFGSDVPFGREYGLTADLISCSRDDFAQAHDVLFDTPSESWHFLGYRFAGGTLDLSNLLTCHYSAIIVPYWFAMLTLFPLPARAVRRTWVTWRRNRSGLCPICGYDLRATSDRCPECGTPVDAKSQATA